MSRKSYRTADHQPAANTEAVASISPLGTTGIVSGVMVHWSYDVAPTGGKLTIKSGTTVISEVDAPAAGPGFLPLKGYQANTGEALSATLAAGGASVTGKVSLSAELL